MFEIFNCTVMHNVWIACQVSSAVQLLSTTLPPLHCFKFCLKLLRNGGLFPLSSVNKIVLKRISFKNLYLGALYFPTKGLKFVLEILKYRTRVLLQPYPFSLREREREKEENGRIKRVVCQSITPSIGRIKSLRCSPECKMLAWDAW